MPRGNLEQQIEAIDEKIEKAMTRVKELKAKRQELIEKKDSVAMQEVAQILQEKNMSAEQAIEILRNHNF
ncbi:MAG: hypothetical protein J6M62_12335 [Selenomonadaceae bacterium]|nr:hypothetical protein [Selenomonadaceae bacterium]MBP3723411.1 hypothetical protein [Selenomonadaceae bacterium]